MTTRLKMKLEWVEKNGDGYADASTGHYEIEQASEYQFWAFIDGTPIGIRRTFDEAKQRCEAVHQDRLAG